MHFAYYIQKIHDKIKTSQHIVNINWKPGSITTMEGVSKAMPNCVAANLYE